MSRIVHYRFVLGNHKRPMRFIVGRALVKSGLCTRLTIQQDGYRLRFYPSNLSEQLWVDHTLREPELTLIRAYLRAGDYVIDVGANVGDTVFTASVKVGATGRVWAIEAHPRIFSFLLGNIALNKVRNVEPLNAAAAEAFGRVGFSDDRRDDMNRVGGAEMEVEARPLDDLVTFRGRIDLLKIDVEGYELPVLRGAAEILALTRCVLIEVAESHFRHFGYDLRTVLSFLEQSGFQLLRPLSNERAARINRDFSTNKVENLIAVRDVEEFTDRSRWVIAEGGK